MALVTAPFFQSKLLAVASGIHVRMVCVEASGLDPTRMRWSRMNLAEVQRLNLPLVKVTTGLERQCSAASDRTATANGSCHAVIHHLTAKKTSTIQQTGHYGGV